MRAFAIQSRWHGLDRQRRFGAEFWQNVVDALGPESATASDDAVRAAIAAVDAGQSDNLTEARRLRAQARALVARARELETRPYLRRPPRSEADQS